MKTLLNKVALVTGASRGLGRGIAVQLGEAGATVYVTGRSPDTRETFTKQLRLDTVDTTAQQVRCYSHICKHAFERN